MGQSSLKCCAVIFVLNVLFALTSADQSNGDHRKVIGLQWYVNKKPNTVLSSNIQRKKRNSNYDDAFTISSPVEKEQMEAFLKALQEPPWTLFTFNEGKRHTVNFTPRLGRESSEEENEDWFPDSEVRKELMFQRSPPFAPRLGKRLNTYYFDPRLGKRAGTQKIL
ncbi:hypothetical protein RN001_015985 [Aquatica leii]|uniref:Uncharacterized protein n=1 Tax=Aquatica leii TaxID=1421715 RepID=A0AAN7S5X8_9COLE|nr:hypothetical protein RN001_015985 [Aquatica leii]